METKHTPGPWTIERPKAFGDKAGCDRTLSVYAHGTQPYTPSPDDISEKAGMQIARMTCYVLASSDKEQCRQHAATYSAKNIEANARLIAAAPDLLQACIHAAKFTAFDPANFAHITKELQAAIAKATN